jgi:tetratricopeptide (TPR) repeat protein
MFPRLLLVLAIAAGSISPVFPQTTNVTISRDIRLFTTMAALNAAGFDIEYGSEYHPVRVAARKYADEVDADLIARLKDFYLSQKGDQSDEAQLPKYISLAVNLGEPPDFKPTMREESLPPDARTVVGFTELLREFYEQAHIGRHWLELKADYDRAITEIGPKLRDAILRSDAYSRIPLGTNVTRGLSIYLELAAPLSTVNVRSNQDSYAVIIGFSTNPKVDDIRHAYLHFQLDSLVTANVGRMQSVSTILDKAKKAAGVDPAYTSEFRVMATESLIRAIELRMDKVPAGRAHETIDTFYRSGLLLTPYFYDALEAYEKGNSSLRDDLSIMARNIRFNTEQTRFEQTFSKIGVSQKSVARSEVPLPEPPPVKNPVADLLEEARKAFNSGDMAKAEAAFLRVLSDFDRDNGAAEYGLGLIASKKGDSDQAKQYFDRVVRNDSVEAGMKTWSYIYRGRIADLECERERAVEYYRQAIKVGQEIKVEDDSQNAQAAAQEGLQKPFGDACK